MEQIEYVVAIAAIVSAFFLGAWWQSGRTRKVPGNCQCSHERCYHGAAGTCYKMGCACIKYVEVPIPAKIESSEDKELKKLREMAGL
jgi:hypothetical protein